MDNVNNVKRLAIIQDTDGTTTEVELITYLISDDNEKTYLVYSKGEKMGTDGDEIIYISKITPEGDILKLSEIVDDNEWTEVQKLLKKIAHA